VGVYHRKNCSLCPQRNHKQQAAQQLLQRALHKVRGQKLKATGKRFAKVAKRGQAQDTRAMLGQYGSWTV